MAVTQIGRVLIGPAQTNVASSTLVKRFEIVKTINDQIGSCTFVVVGTPDEMGTLLLSQAAVQIQERASGSELGPVFGEPVFGEETFGSSDDEGEVLFIGTITRIEPVVLKNRRPYTIQFTDPALWGEAFFGDTTFGDSGTSTDVPAEKYVAYAITCQDQTAQLTKAVLTTPATYTATSDATVLAALFTNAGVSFSMAGVTAQQNVTVQFDTENLMQCIQRVADITGAIFYVRNSVFYYHAPTANPCPYELSDDPDQVTSFDCLRNSMRVTEDSSLLANRILYKGSLTDGGSQLSVTVSDATSISLYGLQVTKIVKRDIKTLTELTDLANGTLAQRKNPQVSASATFMNLVGYEAGQYLACDKSSVRLTASYLIRSARMQWQAKGAVTLAIEFGDWRPNLNRTTQKIATSTQQSPSTPIALPPDASVTTDMITTLNADQINGPITADQIDSVHATSITGGITADQIITVNASGILGSITADQIGSVYVTSFVGNIVGSQIDNLTITGGKIGFGEVGNDQIGTFTADHIIGGTISGIDIMASNISGGSTGVFGDLEATTFGASTGDITDLTCTSLTITNHLFIDPGDFNSGGYTGTFSTDSVLSVAVVNGIITSVI